MTVRLIAAVVVAAVGVLGAVPTTAQAQAPTPRAWIVVDVDTGAVIDAGNARQPLPPASLTKVITALTTVDLPEDALFAVSSTVEARPANKINMRTGEFWELDDVLHSLLLSSANDAAALVAERTAGAMDQYEIAASAVATRLGMADSPVLRDPAGLDDASSVEGGNLVSARDLAIAGRALLADPVLAPIVATREYSFTDPGGEPHKLINHNKLLRLYPGAIGMKTGYTRRAGHSLMAAATRDGRTMLAVVLGSPLDMYADASALLDKGFASVPGAPAFDTLPPVVKLRPDKVVEVAAGEGEVAAAVETGSGGGLSVAWPLRVLVMIVAPIAGLRIRAKRRIALRRRHPTLAD